VPQREPWRGSGRGKLILCGEHAVVYGYPALAMAVDRGTTVSLVLCDGETFATDATIDDPRLVPALRAVLPAEGLSVTIRTDLPIGRGMGSSAALAVALVRADAERTGDPLDADRLWDRAMAVERVFHGNPSGLDHAVSAHGGLVRYRRPEGGARPTLEAMPTPSWPIVVLDSGVAGDTKELVAGVASRRPMVDGALSAIGSLVDNAAKSLDDPSMLGLVLTANHELLRAIGVSTPDLDALVQLALDEGAFGAKLAGAGGGGVVIALHERPEKLLAAARRRGIAAFVCRISP
jgi:mevalonate kinase